MHDRWENLRHACKFPSIVCELLEELSESRKIFSIIISLDSSIFYLFFEFSERISVGTLASLQKSQNSFDLH